jgi:hypothetical protein
MSDPLDSIAARAKICCGTCGWPWNAHPEDCSRHAFRPMPEPQPETPKAKRPPTKLGRMRKKGGEENA